MIMQMFGVGYQPMVGSAAKGWVSTEISSTRRRMELSAGMKEGEEIETEREMVVGPQRVVVSSGRRGGRQKRYARKRGWRKVNCLLWRLGVKLSF